VELINKMPEAEVSLRMAMFLLELENADQTISVAIDGAQVDVGGRPIFDVISFMELEGWKQREKGRKEWQGLYSKENKYLKIQSQAGIGDVSIKINNKRYYVESKGGSLIGEKGNKEYPKLREAIGQLMTFTGIEDDHVLIVAVPDSKNFRSLATNWIKAPLMKKVGIKISLVNRSGKVEVLG